MPRTLLHTAAWILFVSLFGCRSNERESAIEPADTVTDIQPLTPAEIERRAEPMTPEQAEELGVVDTTIQVGEEP